MSSFPASLRRFFLGRLLARGRLAFPVDLPHKRVYIFPTRHGFVFFILLPAILFGAINHNNNLAFLLVFLLGGMAFVSIFHTYRNISGLSLVSGRASPVFAGQLAKFEIILHSQGRERSCLSLHFGDEEPVVVNLAADGRSLAVVSHAARKRGLFRPEQLYVSTTYPLGLFRAWSVLFLDSACLVYPQPLPGPMMTAEVAWEDESEGETGGDGIDDFAGLAPYRPGDPLQRISWKSYSAGRGMHTKHFEGLRGRTLFFDPDILDGKDLEFKLSRICYMILQAEARRMSYGLKLERRIIEPGQGGNHKRQCLHALALVDT